MIFQKTVKSVSAWAPAIGQEAKRAADSVAGASIAKLAGLVAVEAQKIETKFQDKVAIAGDNSKEKEMQLANAGLVAGGITLVAIFFIVWIFNRK